MKLPSYIFAAITAEAHGNRLELMFEIFKLLHYPKLLTLIFKVITDCVRKYPHVFSDIHVKNSVEHVFL